MIPPRGWTKSAIWPSDFAADRVIDATGLIVAPGLVDLAARLREPGHEHEGMLESELAAAAAGGVTSVVCLPDTDPTLDEPGLVEMLKLRARKLSRCRLFPLGALTRGLKGENLADDEVLNHASFKRREDVLLPGANVRLFGSIKLN